MIGMELGSFVNGCAVNTVGMTCQKTSLSRTTDRHNCRNKSPQKGWKQISKRCFIGRITAGFSYGAALVSIPPALISRHNALHYVVTGVFTNVYPTPSATFA